MLQGLIKKVCCRYTSMGYYFGTNIPHSKELTVRNGYRIPENEEIFALIDGTLLSNAKNGIAICTNGIYWRNPWMTKTNITYTSWSEFIQCTLILKSTDIILGNGGIISTMGYMSSEDILNLFKDIQIAILSTYSR